MSAAAIAPYSVDAYNMSWDSENKIHDDEVAKRFGFSGGLVPGVDVYGYMTHQAVARWGRAWLAHGTADCRFLKPVYDGKIATVLATESPAGMAIEVASEGVLCATGAADLPPPVTPPALEDFPATSVRPSRPPASRESLADGAWLGIAPFIVTAEYSAKYLKDLRETETLYANEGLVHPGIVLRACNWALSHNVVLGPWIHVGSRVQNFAPARVGDALSVRARIVRNYDHKGHLFVDLDVLVLTGETSPVARVAHTAIYRPRQIIES
jgi:acyl dehydratase